MPRFGDGAPNANTVSKSRLGVDELCSPSASERVSCAHTDTGAGTWSKCYRLEESSNEFHYRRIFCRFPNTGRVFLVFAARYGRFAPVAGFVYLAVDHPLEITSDSVPLSSRPVVAAMNGTAAEDAC
jgi:hypothetical protein